VKGKVARIPAALVRGVRRPAGDGRAGDLVRPAAADLFRTASGPEDLVAFLEGATAHRRLLPDPVDPAVVERAALAAAAAPSPGGARPLRVVHVASPAGRARYLAVLDAPVGAALEAPEAQVGAAGAATATLRAAPVLLVPCLAAAPGAAVPPGAVELAAGGAVRTLLLALHAYGLAAVWAAVGVAQRDVAAAALDLPAGWRPLATVAAGRPDPAAPARPGPAAGPAEVLLRR
jgi:coenzyme F420-0:L-glutamate ligase / coenzyme F420-1:gamma-L-glutamate ligase